MSVQPNILILGSTGLTGAETVRLLSKAGFSVRATYRENTELQQLSSYAVSHPVQADFNDPPSLLAAMEGVSKVVSITPVHEKAQEWNNTILECAKEAGVEHLTRMSQIGAHADCMSPIGLWHYEADEALKNSGIGYTIVKPASFYQNLFWSALTIIRANVFALPLGEASVAMVDSRDVSRILAHMVVDQGHLGQEYVITGPRPMTMHVVARRLAKAIGKDVRYRPVPLTGSARVFLDAGLPVWQAQATVEMFGEYSTGNYDYATNHFKTITGKDPLRFETFARDYSTYFIRETAGSLGGR